MKLRMEKDAVRFCRRVGEKKNGPRPLVCGFWDEQEKGKVLRYARQLEGTAFKDVSVGPDLTKLQREEETEMRREATRRNEEELTAEDQGKNLRWAAVGDRGQKYLIKTVAREEQGSSRGGEAWRRREELGRTTGAVPKQGQRGSVMGGRYMSRQTSPAAKEQPTKDKEQEQPVERREKEPTTTEESEVNMDSESETAEEETETEGEEVEVEEREKEKEKEKEKKKRKRKQRSPGGGEEAPPRKR